MSGKFENHRAKLIMTETNMLPSTLSKCTGFFDHVTSSRPIAALMPH